jgi:OOP family OmpA-OmpF porin
VAAAPDSPHAGRTTSDFGTELLAKGAVALDDLVFDSGSATLEQKDYASLSALAAWLVANPTRHVTLVGHTDAVGTLLANTALSRQRAQSVRDTLIARLGAAADQIDAQGAGYLAPRATNETPEGRTANRRVEVMLTPTP